MKCKGCREFYAEIDGYCEYCTIEGVPILCLYCGRDGTMDVERHRKYRFDPSYNCFCDDCVALIDKAFVEQPTH